MTGHDGKSGRRRAHETAGNAHGTARSAHKTSGNEHEMAGMAQEMSGNAHEVAGKAHETYGDAHGTVGNTYKTIGNAQEIAWNELDAAWEADWIWRSRRVRVNDFAYFRKEFRVRSPLQRALLFYSAHNTAKVFLNGAKLGGYVSPAPTNPEKRKAYLAYDVTELLEIGPNCLTADAHYLGGGGQNYYDGLPGFRLQLHLVYENGSEEIVKTNSSWHTLKSMPHEPGTLYQQNRRVSAIEAYDARKLDPRWRYAAWREEGAAARAKPARIGREDWPMEAQRVPEGAIAEEIACVKLPLPHGGGAEFAQVFDAGAIVSGWPRLALPGISGATVRLRYSEDLDENGRVKPNVANERSDNYYDEYTMRGDALETWQPDFSYKAFRYVEVTGYPREIAEGELIVCWAYTGMAQVGEFSCSDGHLNELYAACIRTQKNNTLGQTVDCPHREQAQYIADTDLQAEALLYNFDAVDIAAKTLTDFADAQLEDGTFPFVAPINYGNPDFHIQIPEWDLHYATLMWKAYEASGDVGVLKRFYETARRMADYFVGIRDADAGLVPLDKGWHISDWPYPSVEHQGRFLTVQQIKLVIALRTISRAADLIGRGEEGKAYAGYADRLGERIVERLYDRERKRFRDSSESEACHQGVTAIALAAGLVPEGDREQVIASVAEQRWECRTVLSLPLLRVLLDNGREAEAFALLNRREYPGWGHMIAQGSKTMWEGWEDIESHSHAWNGYPARLLQEYVVGIRAEAPGFARTVIRPYMPDSLTFAEGKVWTPLGPIYARWEREGGGVRVRATIPAGMEARLSLRLADGRIAKRGLNEGDNDVLLRTDSERRG
ncbi:family 78 glycoside hydrolase catalytic domain [Cohnella cellulosilytica]|uniref:alpha-L-rhamnosidase n=1 Tax=Cohnella cellulosilytica TaxID=986710 RepID=A0ABW2FHV4_9BACL